MRRVLVICPHPDDESIGCGGTLRRHVLDGDIARAVFLTSGEVGGGVASAERARLRECEAVAASAILGLADVEFWHEPDSALRARHALAARLRAAVEAWRPDLLYVTHDREMHADHRAAARLVRRVLSTLPPALAPPAVRMFEVWTPLSVPDEIVDISPHVAVKVAAIRAYASQCREMRYDEAALALSRYRGEMYSWEGGDYAEVFAAMRVTTSRSRPQ